ncbi:hypothetical protein KR038_008584, partial [Drosophila bunnanda]
FRRRAEELHAALQERGLRQLQLRLNATGAPRRGAFELSLVVARNEKEEEKPVPLWSGLKRGPPRALKFPNVDEVYEQIVGILGGDKSKESSENASVDELKDSKVSKYHSKPKES